jgi:5'-3' exonuclease
VAICWGAEAAAYRKELLPSYHADRPPVPDALQWQLDQAGPFWGAFGWHALSHDTLEADDLLSSLATVEVEAGGRALLFTGDVHVLFPAGKGKGEPDVIDPREVRRRYGIPPELVPDFIALRGDPSDSIPGGKGIGEKTARDLLLSYGTLEGAIANAVRERPRVQAALRDQADELRAYKEIATLVHVPVERPADRPTDWARAAETARAHGMNRLAERLAAKAG